MTRFSQAALDALMPMHVVIGPTGHIVSAGPTISRLCAPGNFVGRRLAEVFELRKPQVHDARMDSLRALAGERLLLQLRQAPRTQFKGILVPADGDASLLLNLSFGIGAMAAVQDHDLNNADFAPTDLTIEMLYLHEAKRVLDGEFRRVNARLESSRDKAHFQAMTDALTGLRNRRAMEAEMAARPLLVQSVSRCSRSIWICSNRSTTLLDMRPEIGFWKWRPSGCWPIHATSILSPALAATNS